MNEEFKKFSRLDFNCPACKKTTKPTLDELESSESFTCTLCKSEIELTEEDQARVIELFDGLDQISPV